MKRVISKETLLAYLDFDKPFVIHTDDSHTQLGAVISQDNKPIAFYSRKLKPEQTQYMTTERELLSIVETILYRYTPTIRTSCWKNTKYPYYRSLKKIMAIVIVRM
jgi:RNase H-like domain found in reverse transcriptase